MSSNSDCLLSWVVANETSRTVGPSGNGDNTNQGNPFWTSDVLALGSFASALGLSGLFFYKNSSNSTNKDLNPASNSTN
ncbi:hypothetical protein LXA43DRAFT_1093856 [Ganoderma leucocontextum]|nr:hypothetical protein LXA43DRAFT_1093856 [Ganoderma leucocontextum]